MPTTYRTAQVQGASAIGSYVNLYNTTASTSAVLSSIAITNTASTSGTYRIALVPASASSSNPSASNWLVYDSVVAGNDTIFLTVGITVENSEFIRVSSSATTVTFTGFVSEIS